MKLVMKASSPSMSSGSNNYSIRAMSVLPPERRRMSCCSFQFATSGTPKPAIFSAHAVASPDRTNRFDGTNSYTLQGIRNSLILQEDNIIFSLLERAQFCYNAETYDPYAFAIVGFQCSLAEYMVKETEKVHARVGRYDSLVEQPFFPSALPHSMLPPLCYPQVLHPAADLININVKVWEMYLNDLLPRLVKQGDDGNHASSAVCDTKCLQALSKRIHYGKFVAEAKFQDLPDPFKDAIKAQDKAQIMDLLTHPDVEEVIIKRIELKTRACRQEMIRGVGENGSDPAYEINPSLVATLYKDWIMPLTKEVQLQYLLRRLD